MVLLQQLNSTVEDFLFNRHLNPCFDILLCACQEQRWKPVSLLWPLLAHYTEFLVIIVFKGKITYFVSFHFFRINNVEIPKISLYLLHMHVMYERWVPLSNALIGM